MAQRPTSRRCVAAIVLGALTAVGCADAQRHDPTDHVADDFADDVTDDIADAAPATVENYPDAIARYLDRLADAPRPVDDSAMPPRHLDVERFPEALVERSLIVSGGPPPDGIAPIDAPAFASARDIDWLADDEPVLAVRVGEAVRAYPVQIMVWHEIVNDEIAGVPVTVSYCPLCNSGLAFDRRLDGDLVDFGTSGALYQSNLVMYDRQTESLWTQFDGRAVVGTRVGDVLDQFPVTTISFGDFRRDHPTGDVLTRDTGFSRPYGRNPYNAYDQRTAPISGFYTGEPDATLPPYQRVIGIEAAGEVLAVVTQSVADAGVASLDVGGRPLTVWHLDGLASPLNDGEIAAGADIGATAVFDRTLDDGVLDFQRVGERIIDTTSGSTWNLLGEAVDGPLRGRRLNPVNHVDTFWFAWATFHVEAALISEL